jgi:hypothetical protein
MRVVAFAEWRRAPTIFIYAPIRRSDTRKRTHKDAGEMIDWAIGRVNFKCRHLEAFATDTDLDQPGRFSKRQTSSVLPWIRLINISRRV